MDLADAGELELGERLVMTALLSAATPASGDCAIWPAAVRESSEGYFAAALLFLFPALRLAQYAVIRALTALRAAADIGRRAL